MGADSKIQWTTHTFNHVRGCTKVSDGCCFCYADTLSKRNPKSLGIWGPRGTRAIAAESYWREPFVWDRQAKAEGLRHRVFCASLADVFEGPETMPADAVEPVEAARLRLAKTIDDTPNLDWLLLTKRPENIPAMISRMFPDGRTRHNVWLGTSVENQEMADLRIPLLVKCPAVVRFLSIEPLLGDINLADKLDGIDWCIVGGESGPKARECHISWISNIYADCLFHEVALFVKQLGSNPMAFTFDDYGIGDVHPMELVDSKGGDISEFPEPLRRRQIPSPRLFPAGGVH